MGLESFAQSRCCSMYRHGIRSMLKESDKPRSSLKQIHFNSRGRAPVDYASSDALPCCLVDISMGPNKGACTVQQAFFVPELSIKLLIMSLSLHLPCKIPIHHRYPEHPARHHEHSYRVHGGFVAQSGMSAFVFHPFLHCLRHLLRFPFIML